MNDDGDGSWGDDGTGALPWAAGEVGEDWMRIGLAPAILSRQHCKDRKKATIGREGKCDNDTNAKYGRTE